MKRAITAKPIKFEYTAAPDYRHASRHAERASLSVDRYGMVQWGSDGPEFHDDDD